ncbi:MAG: GDP-mannose 4,6-dehydratase [Rhodothermales bacterium]|nr:GDP-mannose 4,6-dehydratase [Rhodothermales bacterium]
MRCLITGGAGFIGSHLADYLLAQGQYVHIIDNLSTGRLENVDHLLNHDRFESTIADILDYSELEKQISRCDHVYHLAAAVGVRLIMEQPVETIVTNVRGTENVLMLASQYRKKVLVASTSEVYGKLMETKSGIERLREDDDLTIGATNKRRWAYACSKTIDEFLALAYSDEKKLPVVVTRFFNTVGPRQTGRYGMVIPNFVQRALANEPIQVFGDGEQSRCFTYVGDAVRAIVQLMQTPSAEGQVYNIGGHEEITMNELARRVKRIAGSSSAIQHIPYEQTYGPGFEDMRRRTPDISKLSAAIGHTPTYTTDDILHEVVRHFRNAGKPTHAVPVKQPATKTLTPVAL